MKQNNYFEWIDFLRGISCLGIVLYHVRIDLWVGWVEITSNPQSYSLFDRIAALLSIPLPFLRPVVIMFVLISGFCIHFPHAAGERPLESKIFFSRRIVRIYPPYLFAILLSVGALWAQSMLSSSLWMGAPQDSRLLESIFLVQNWWDGFGQIATNPSLWFVPVQMELYLVYPSFLWLVLRYGFGPMFAGVGLISLSSLALLLMQYGNSPDRHLGSVNHFPMFWVIWCAGAMLAEGVKTNRLPRWQPWFGMVMAVLFVVAIATSVTKQYIGLQEMVWASVYFMLLFWGLTHKNPTGWLPRPVVASSLFLSLVSYSLYLIHFPLFKLVGALWVSYFGSKPANFLIALGFSALAVLVAYGFFIAVEKPTQRLTLWLSSRLTVAR